MRAARVDSNQNEIVSKLRKMGITVEPGHDDLLVGYKGETYWFEVKNQNKLKKDGTFQKGALKPSQEKIRLTWKGQYNVVCYIEEILTIIGYEHG